LFPKLLHAHQRAGLVDRSMTVGTQDGQIIERGLNGASGIAKRTSMMNFSHITG
jgi:hypothetical protein